MPKRYLTPMRRFRSRVLDVQLANDELRGRIFTVWPVPAELAPVATRAQRQLDALLPTLVELQRGLGPYVDDGPPDLAA